MSRTIEVSDETFEKIKDQLLEEEQVDMNCMDDLIGNKVFFRTVTYHMVGKITNRVGMFVQLKDASWVADSGRFADAIRSGTLKEVEPVGTCWVNLNTCTDFFPWKHSLPKEQK